MTTDTTELVERRRHMFELVDDHDAFLGNHSPGDEVRAVLALLDAEIERLTKERDAALEAVFSSQEASVFVQIRAERDAAQAKLAEADNLRALLAGKCERPIEVLGKHYQRVCQENTDLQAKLAEAVAEIEHLRNPPKFVPWPND